MKNHLFSLLGMLSIILALTSTKSYCQDVAYSLNEKEYAFVILQLKSGKGQEAMSEPDVLKVNNQIKATNTKLGYEEFEKKLASFTLDENGHQITYLTIRNFNDLTSAKTYAQSIEKELPKDLYGKIQQPFPINQTDYKRCVEEKDFKTYFKYYSKSVK